MSLQVYLPKTEEAFSFLDEANAMMSEILNEAQEYRKLDIWELIQSNHPQWGRLGSRYLTHLYDRGISAWAANSNPGAKVA